MIIVHGDPDFLAHYGVLGMKWGVRRFQNEDGSLTAAGKQRYKTDSGLHRVGRALFNSSLGQRFAVAMNKGYREDKRNAKAERKRLRDEIKQTTTGDERKNRLKELKGDYKKTLAEARTATAQANYSWQSDETNRRIQSENLAKSVFKNALLGSYGSLSYDRARATGDGRLYSFAYSLLGSLGNAATGGLLSVGDYAIQDHKSRK